MRVRLSQLIMQKLYVHKYINQYAKRRRKVGQNFWRVCEEEHRLRMNSLSENTHKDGKDGKQEKKVLVSFVRF